MEQDAWCPHGNNWLGFLVLVLVSSFLRTHTPARVQYFLALRSSIFAPVCPMWENGMELLAPGVRPAVGNQGVNQQMATSPVFLDMSFFSQIMK